MTRTRSSSSSSANSSSYCLRNGQQTKKSLTHEEMMIKMPRKRIKSQQELSTKRTSMALPVQKHLRRGFEDQDDHQVNSNTRLHESDEDDMVSLEDEELPAVKFDSSTAKTKVKELVPGTVVWAKSRCWPHWPAVLVKVFSNEKKAWINYFYETNQRVQVSLRSITPFFGSSRSKFIDTGKASKYSDDFTTALERAEDYLIKQGLGKSAESTSNITFSSVIDKSTSPTVSPSRMSLSHKTIVNMSHNTDEPSAALPTNSNSTMSSDEELCIGHPVIHSSRNTDSKADDELLERRRLWKYTEKKLLKYIHRDTTKNHLLAIYHGKTKSERQRLFKSTRTMDRQKLRLMAGLGPITDEELESELTSFLRDLYVENCMECKEDIPNTSYITEVWLPEAIIFAIQKTRRVGRCNAEKLFHSEGVQSLVDFGEDMPIVPSIVSQSWDEF